MPSTPLVRDLLLIDIENLVGGNAASEAAVRLAIESSKQAACSANLLPVIASGSTLFARTAWAWPRSARRLIGCGLDGADNALLEVL